MFKKLKMMTALAAAGVMMAGAALADFPTQPIVVLNVPGAGGSVGARRVHDSEADGHTILLTHLSLLTAAGSGKLDFPHTDLVPVAGTADACMVTAVMEDAPWGSINELMDATKADPDTVVAGVNIGGVNHMAAMLLEVASGGDFRMAQIGGGAKNFEAMKGGHTAVAQFAMAEFANFRAGGVKGLAVLGPDRHPAMPDLPTAKEMGYDIQLCLQNWWFAPKGTPDEAVNALAEMLQKAMQNADVKAAIDARMMTASFVGPADLPAQIAAEWEAIGPLAAEAAK